MIQKIKSYIALTAVALSLVFVISSLLNRDGQAFGREMQPTGKFNHTSPKHSQLKCEQCHWRKADTIKPRVPGHSACISCHVKEFTSTQFGICSNCHDGISATRPLAKSFPERQTFGMEFKHQTHAVVDASGKKRADCSSCHNASGTRATFPGHKECYVCHKAPDQVRPGERSPDGNCGVCHTTTGNRKPLSAGGPAYKYRFSHQTHLAKLGNRCDECHKVLGEGAVEVSQPKLSEHRGAGFANSCGSCHNGKRAFGGEIEHDQCARCHGRKMM